MSAKHIAYFKLLAALKEGCPICTLMIKTTQQFMDGFLYESINDASLRQEIRKSEGFCQRHAWQLHKLGDGFGQAIVNNDLLNSVLKRLKDINGSLSLKALLKQIAPAKTNRQICLFCQKEKETEEHYIKIFWAGFNDPEFSLAYKNSIGLCLPHLTLCLKQCPNQKLGSELITIETKKIINIIGELKEFIRKHDYRYSSEKFGSEGDSWIRAIEKMVGKKGMF